MSADFKDELLGLKDQIESLQRREQDLETLFISYIDLKEKEFALTRIGDTMLLEVDCFDLLDKEISLMEEESGRIEKFVSDYLRISEELGYWKSETGLLRRQVKMLLCKKKVQYSRFFARDGFKASCRRLGISRAHEALGTSNNVVDMLENELSEMRIVLDQLKGEKNDLLNKVI